MTCMRSRKVQKELISTYTPSLVPSPRSPSESGGCVGPANLAMFLRVVIGSQRIYA